MWGETVLVVIILLPFVGSFLSLLFRVRARNAVSWFAGSTAAAAFGLVVASYPEVTGGRTVHYTAAWLPELGLDLTLRMDGLAWALAILITGIGLLVVVYAHYYMSPSDSLRGSSRFCSPSWARCSASWCPEISFSSSSSGN